MNIPLGRVANLPKGNYRVRIEKAELSAQPGSSGYHYINLTYMVIGRDGKPTGRQIFDRLSLSPKARFMMENFLDAIEAEKKGNMNIKNLRNKSLWVSIDHREYQGKIQLDVKDYLSPNTEYGPEDEDPEPSYESYDDDNDDSGSTPKSFNPLDADEEDSDSSVVADMPDELASEDIPY